MLGASHPFFLFPRFINLGFLYQSLSLLFLRYIDFSLLSLGISVLVTASPDTSSLFSVTAENPMCLYPASIPNVTGCFVSPVAYRSCIVNGFENATFDTQKMKNPEISGIEYQQGELQGYEIREYLLEKFHRKCVYCGKTNIPLEIEHLTLRSRNGPDTVDNLAISCHDCNQKKNNLTAEEFGYPEVRKRALIPLKNSAFMNIVRWKLAQLTEAAYTFGYITKKNRISLGLDKSHANDAFVIAGGTNQARTSPFTITQRRRDNRSIQTNRKGFRPSIRRRRYAFQPGDIVVYDHERFSVVGMHNYEKSIVIKGGGKKMDINTKKVKLVKYGKGLQFAPQRNTVPLCDVTECMICSS